MGRLHLDPRIVFLWLSSPVTDGNGAVSQEHDFGICDPLIQPFEQVYVVSADLVLAGVDVNCEHHPELVDGQLMLDALMVELGTEFAYVCSFFLGSDHGFTLMFL